MNNTAILLLVSIVVIGLIFWLVIYSGQRMERHREKTTIKPSDSGQEE